MTETLARLTRMGPDEIRTRAQQALSKRWGRPPVFETISSAATPIFPDSAILCPLQQAEKICRHRFDLLGYKDLDFGSPIDWHLDPVHHKRGPRKPWYKIPFLDFDQIGDHKIIWELNRHQHLVTLAEAWRLTKDDRFAAELRSQWDHWQRENPYPIGINWASTLEVAFRALSWLWVRHLIGDFHGGLLRGLHLHGWHIERYLSTYYSPNTHLLGEGVALFAIGLLCPQIRGARRWQSRGWNIVLRQAETQVRPDGFHFEQSFYYHVYALDFFQFARDLAAPNGIAIPASFDRTIEKMNEAISALSQACRPPSFGDDDGGRVLGSPARPLGPSPAHSPALTAAGIYTMTTAQSQLFIDAGPQGVFAGGHGHADALSIQLITDGRSILIDPGTFCYTCPERNRFRGTAAHNTLQVDGRDQATPAGPFAWTGMPETTVDVWLAGETFDLFAGHHNGYAPVIHHRWVFGHKSGFWLVRDLITEPRPSGSGYRLDVNWHFLDGRDISILPPAGHAWSHSIEPFDWSPVYGRKELAFVQRFSAEVSLPAEFAVILAPGAPGVFTETAPGSYRYELPQGSYEFIFPLNGARFIYRANIPEGPKEFSI
jgi:Heparinase II/III-like protein/Heparinase II/III N-terminus